MIIDYLSLTMKLSDAYQIYLDGGYVGYSLKGQVWRSDLALDDVEFAVSTVHAFLHCANRSGEQAGLQLRLRDRGMFGYEKSIVILDQDNQQVGVAAFGGNRGTLFISLTGIGCRLFDMVKVNWFLGLTDAKITRVDIAFDDFEGRYNVQYAIDGYYADRFTLRSRPKARLIDDCGNNTGKTFYVGNAKNGKMVRVYEKGKQLGDELSPWVRWELQLNAVDRVLPHDILLHETLYFLDGYPILNGIIPDMEPTEEQHITVLKESRSIAYGRLIHYCRLAYGKMFNFMADELCMTPTAIFTELFRGGVPARLLTDLSQYRSVVEGEKLCC